MREEDQLDKQVYRERIRAKHKVRYGPSIRGDMCEIWVKYGLSIRGDIGEIWAKHKGRYV